MSFLDFVDCFFPVLWTFSLYFLKYCLRSFLFLFSFLDPYNEKFGVFNVVSKISRFSPFFFSLFCIVAEIYTILSSRSLIHSSASLILLLIPSSLFFFQFVYYPSLFVYNSSKCLLNISCVFSIFPSILFQRCWIIFTVIILNSFSGRLPISSSFSCFSGVLLYSFIWDIIFCLLILFNFLLLWFLFWSLQDCSSSWFFCLTFSG